MFVLEAPEEGVGFGLVMDLLVFAFRGKFIQGLGLSFLMFPLRGSLSRVLETIIALEVCLLRIFEVASETVAHCLHLRKENPTC